METKLVYISRLLCVVLLDLTLIGGLTNAAQFNYGNKHHMFTQSDNVDYPRSWSALLNKAGQLDKDFDMSSVEDQEKGQVKPAPLLQPGVHHLNPQDFEGSRLRRLSKSILLSTRRNGVDGASSSLSQSNSREPYTSSEEDFNGSFENSNRRQKEDSLQYVEHQLSDLVKYLKHLRQDRYKDLSQVFKRQPPTGFHAVRG